MQGFPTHFTDNRLLSEVINPKFTFIVYDDSPWLHCDHNCPDHVQGRNSCLTTKDLSVIDYSALCPNCMAKSRSLIRNWHQSVALHGPAVYAIATGPAQSENGQPRDLGCLLVKRIIAHYQVMTLTHRATQTNDTWVVSVLPSPLASWFNQAVAEYAPWRDLAGPVFETDTKATLECAIRLWENAPARTPLTVLENTIETARAICN
jgi:hypothetical protein